MTTTSSTLQGRKLTERLQTLLTNRQPWIKKRVADLSRDEKDSLAGVASEATLAADTGLRAQAISGLAQLGKPESAEALAHILENPKEDMHMRVLAASGLGQIPGPNSEAALVRSLSTKEDLVRIRAVQALGRVGTLESLEALRKMSAPTTRAEGNAVKLAEILIAFRNDLEIEDETFTPGRSEMPTDVTDTLTVTMQLVGSREIAAVREALEGGEYGVGVDDNSGFEVICGRAKWVVLLNAIAGSGGIAKTIAQRRMLLALMARYVRENRTYSVQHVVLTRPSDNDAAEIMVLRSDGTPCYSGTASIKDKGVDFSISDIERPGTAPVMIGGFLDSGGIRLDVAASARRRINKKTTLPITR